MHVVPNRYIGPFALGSTIHEILAHIKASPPNFPSFEIYFDHHNPIAEPITINLPKNGMRLRFDGKEQRLRLIEVYDFWKTRLVYKDVEIVKITDTSSLNSTALLPSKGPTFRHVYDKLLGPTFGGEYTPPARSEEPHASGEYVLSYPGIAFSFPVRDSAYSPNKEFIPLLSSSAASPATSMVLFNGEDWPSTRQTLFTAPAPPRLHVIGGKTKDEGSEEIELAKVRGPGRVDLLRRSGHPVEIILGETTPQDLIMDLGSPDAIHWKSDRRLSIHKERTNSQASDRSTGLSGRHGQLSVSADSSALQSEDDDSSDWEDDPETLGPDSGEASSEHFYNYYSHGFDILISEAVHKPPPSPQDGRDRGWDMTSSDEEPPPAAQLTATKIIFHGNIPGSYQFNRHRRSRWTIDHIPLKKGEEPLTSELSFSNTSNRLQQVFKSFYVDPEEEALMQRGMAINRGWGDSPGSSCELLGGFEEGVSSSRRRVMNETSISDMEGSEGSGVGRTTLYGFPGLIFEVMENDAICTLTVY
ncbi:hypothetical protein EJ05DRAFT_505771 [Pseudovirgaria hyperparasitica]|uniref:Uncharacterized protein n=1 Tax=Pseudovirgaria hyperparasitica TaxID=470096 RepID=A0A6A6VR95_9PEZI|nr:uncharacterized protein EJ05DRAFT_505771 [Pseudovirgaria hyperparasitica]KAF2752723.1 hypothetical protein EJ05DRAFT_505771 [Pseudovirgaria hyperparasitica]